MKKLKTILLIDDSPATNLFNRKLIVSMDLCDHVEVKENGKEALDYIKQEGIFFKKPTVYPLPDMIIVDIDMPVMNGFEFVQKYNSLDLKFKSPEGVIISMLTQNYSSNKYEISKDKLGVHDFIVKPLDKEGIIDLWDKFIY